MRTVAGEEFRFSQNRANQERAPDCVRITGSRSRDLRQYRRHSEIVSVNNIKYTRKICQDIEMRARCGLRLERLKMVVDDDQTCDEQSRNAFKLHHRHKFT